MGRYEEAIVYAWACFNQREIGGRELDSSHDRYDVEYGWTAEDYRRASGGTLVNYYTVGINVFSLNTEKDNEIAIRLNRVPDKREGGGSIILHGRGDTVVLHKQRERLLDIGKHGIFDTLTGKKLHASPNEKDRIVRYDGTEIFFMEEYPAHDPPVFRIDLEDGLKSGKFRNEKVPRKGRIAAVIERDFEEGLWRRHLAPFTFELHGKKYTVDNRQMENWAHVESTRIIDDKQRVVLEGHRFRKYVIDAVGFPEDILLENFPILRND